MPSSPQLGPTAPISYWHDSLVPGDDLTPRPTLPGDLEVDVAIVGAGFTGLWTAHSLLTADPGLRVVVLERETAGFGASGRNGGWCVGDYGGPVAAVEKVHGPGSVERMAREMHRSVDEVGAVVSAAGIDCGWHKGGAVYFATNKGELRRTQQHHRHNLRYGIADAWQLLDAAATATIVHVPGVLGSLFTPHAATVHPARLARGLAVEVERLGGTVHERTTAHEIRPGGSAGGPRVRTEHGTVRAEVVVQGTEAYTGSLRGQRRAIVPLGNFVIATDPIDDATWAEIGLADRQLFELSSMLLGYGHRTADGRIVWGGHAAQSRWASRIPPTPTQSTRIAERLRRSLERLFPPLAGIGVSHTWHGVLGVPRDLLPGIGHDRTTGLAWGGGYTGQGVAAANAAGRGLADLIRGIDSPETHLPWVGHRSRRWEPEPLRWLGVHAFTSAAHLTDALDRRRG
jgi:glycine/D-amino acid oxidase-like deaminating enzyme